MELLGIPDRLEQGKTGALLIKTERKKLETGDYSIVGLENRICCERKSIEDLFGSCIGERRERFETEHVRMRNIRAAGGCAAVVIEEDIAPLLRTPPLWTNINPKTVERTWQSWLVKYGVPWIFCMDRRLAEIRTFRILEKYWQHFGHKEITAETQEESGTW